MKNYNFIFSIVTEEDPNTVRKHQFCAALRHAGEVQIEFAQRLKAEKATKSLSKGGVEASETIGRMAMQMATEFEQLSLEDLAVRLIVTDLRTTITKLIASLDQILNAPSPSKSMAEITVAKARETREAYRAVLKIHDEMLP